MPAPTIEQLQDQRNLAIQLRDLSTHCHAAEEIRGEERRHRQELERLHQAHPVEWRGLDARLRTHKTWHALQPLAVWLLDVTLLYYLLDFYVRSFAGWLRDACLFLIPGVVVYLEVCFASRAAEARSRGDEAGARYWSLIAVIWAFAVAVGVAVVVWFQNEDFPLAARILLTFTLGGLTLVAHLTLAKGGDQVLDGIAYWRFTASQRKLGQRAARLEEEARRREQVAASRFQEYMAGFTRYAQVHANGRLQAGPFDRVTQDVLHRIYGYAVIQTPNGNSATASGNGHHTAPNVSPQPPAAAPPVAAPNPSDGDGEVAYLREILERRIRDEEGEVRP